MLLFQAFENTSANESASSPDNHNMHSFARCNDSLLDLEDSTLKLPGYFPGNPDVTSGTAPIDHNNDNLTVRLADLPMDSNSHQSQRETETGIDIEADNPSISPPTNTLFHDSELDVNPEFQGNWHGFEVQSNSDIMVDSPSDSPPTTNVVFKDSELSLNSEFEDNWHQSQRETETDIDIKADDPNTSPGTNTLFHDNELDLQWHAFEVQSNCDIMADSPSESPSTNVVFKDSSLSVNSEFEDNWHQSQREPESDIDIKADDPSTSLPTNTLFHESELDVNPEFQGNWHQFEVQSMPTDIPSDDFTDKSNNNNPPSNVDPNETFQTDDSDDDRKIVGNWDQQHTIAKSGSIQRRVRKDESDESKEELDGSTESHDDNKCSNDSSEDSEGFSDDSEESSDDLEDFSDDFSDDEFSDSEGETVDDVFSHCESSDDGFTNNSDSRVSRPALVSSDQTNIADHDSTVQTNTGNDNQFRNWRFSSEELNHDLGDFILNKPPMLMEGVRNAESRLPPPSQSRAAASTLPRGLDANRNIHQEVFLQSLLDAPENSAATKQDLAMLTQILSEQRLQAEQTQLAQAQQLQALNHPNPPQPSNRPGPVRQKSNNVARRDANKTQLHKLVRQHAIEMMRRVPTLNKSPTPITSATADELQRFAQNPTNPELGPQPNSLVLDFNPRSGSASIWNKKATTIFADSFIQKHNQYNAEEARQAFKTHIFQLKNQYKEYREFVEKSERLGDQMDILSYREAKIHNSRMSRRKRVLRRRVKGCNANLDKAEINNFKDLWETMPVEAISGDETDHHHGQARYIVTSLPWRAAWVHRWMLVFDRLHLANRFTLAKRATRGAFPHIRISVDRPHEDRECTSVPAGLPENFYCKGWLSKQSPTTIQSLRMQPPIDETFSSEIIRTRPTPLSEIPMNVNMDMIETGWGRVASGQDVEPGQDGSSDSQHEQPQSDSDTDSMYV